ncbi:MAG: diguanylate cyclase domain-containing protein [Noviherbaspirillum sp.]
MSQASAMEKRCILAVDDDRFLLAKLERGMRDVVCGTLQATSGEQALPAIAGRTPDLASPDVSLCGMSGLALARRLRQRTAIPFLFLFVRQDARLAPQANFDALTGLADRHWLDRHPQAVLERARRSGCMPAVPYLDPDGFKVINDTMGYPAGDACIIMAGRVDRESGASHGAYRVAEALKKPFGPSRERGSGGRLDRHQPIPGRCGQGARTGAEYRPGDVSCQVGGKGALPVL